MNPIDQWLWHWATASVTQPLSRRVPSNDSDYFQTTGFRKLGFRAVRKELAFLLSGQRQHLVNAISPQWRRGVWLYFGVPQIGDALMDLAPRSLLTERGIQLDLVTHPHLADLFQADPWFTAVHASQGQHGHGIEAAYDFVIVPSHKHRSLQHKRGPLSALPWVSMHGRYTGPEFQRADFATQRLTDLTASHPSAEDFVCHARPKLGAPNAQSVSPGLCLVMGGVDPSRSYPHWAQVASILRQNGVMQLTLLGSDNGKAAAEQVEAAWHGAPGLLNLVGKTTLQECQDTLVQATHVAAADGGLMHMAVALGRPTTSLFTASVAPAWRLPPDLIPTSLQSTSPLVGDIDPAAVANMVLAQLNTPGPATSLPKANSGRGQNQ